jgi:hypothetical protein
MYLLIFNPFTTFQKSCSSYLPQAKNQLSFFFLGVSKESPGEKKSSPGEICVKAKFIWTATSHFASI